ncbi:MAG: hypothetical protein Q9174_005141, partial [Haloplaca sp. 1 TL-2023]
MTKRKQDRAVSANNDDIHASKRRRTDKNPPNGAGIEAPFEAQSIAPPAERNARKTYNDTKETKKGKEGKKARRLAKKNARRERRELGAQAGKNEPKKEKAHQGEVASAEKSITAKSSKPRKRRKDEKQKSSNDKHGSSQKAGDTALWRVSEPIGGRMLDVDPLFSLDESYLLIAFATSIRVYSSATSLPVRRLSVRPSERISAFAFSCKNPSHLYVGTHSGVVELWDWLEGRRLHLWFYKCQIFSLAVAESRDSNGLPETIYTIDRAIMDKRAMGPWRISAHRLLPDSEAKQSEVATLRKSKEPITSFKVVENGENIIATSGSILTLGTTRTISLSPLKTLSYTWRDVECPERISSFDVRVIREEMTSKQKTSEKYHVNPRLDIAIGGLKGSLHVYDDLLRKLIQKEKSSVKHASLNFSSYQKHWHRNAVLSVKWSRDGNYILSGGFETVLLIWQLESGSDSMLPHLGAPLEGIVVSPSGSSYAVRLADNSAMIVSTAELKPTFSVAGIQHPTIMSNQPQLPHVPTVDAPEQKSQERRLQPPIVSAPAGLLCAVPSTVSSRVSSMVPQNAAYLQTLDLRSAAQVSKQALTRTKATDLNLGPESNTIEEPNVILMQSSSAGEWLAT